MRLGVFGGKNSFNHIVVFGLAIMNGESAESMLTVFKNFFEIVGKPPETILTDEQISIAAVLTGCTPKKYVQAAISSIISADKKFEEKYKQPWPCLIAEKGSAHRKQRRDEVMSRICKDARNERK